MPNYNHASELDTSLSAIVDQSRPFDEIIIVDDASTDHSLQTIARFAARCPQLKLLRNSERLGVAASVNRGISSATGSHVVLASADERVADHMCSTFARVLDVFPELHIAVSRYSEWDERTGIVTEHDQSSPLGMWYATQEDPFEVSPEQFRSLLRQRFVWLGINTAIFRRGALLDVGGFDPNLQWHCDWFVSYAVAFRHGFCAVPRTLAWFRHSPDSYSARGMRNSSAQEKVVVAIVEKLTKPEFADVGRAVRRSPAALSTFIRAMIPALAKRPRYYGFLFDILRWWFGEVLRWRRPRMLLELRERLLGRHATREIGRASCRERV